MDGATDFDTFEWSDDESIDGAKCDELNPKFPTSILTLHEAEPVYRDGAAKTHIKGSPSGPNIYYDKQSDCSISIDRLVWVDGWRRDGVVDPMTLVVLKLRFDPEAPNAKISYASVRLRLKSDKDSGEDPKIVAWGPFRRPEIWNTTEAQRRSYVSPSLTASVGGGGQQVSFGVKTEDEINWPQRYTEYGQSAKKTNGVRWQVFANKLADRGITPEIRVAALFSRPTPLGGYKVELDVVTITGWVSQAGHKFSRLMGKHGGDRTYWSVEPRPGEKDNCHDEGLSIVKEVDLSNLGAIADPQDCTTLKAGWLNKWDRFENRPQEAETPPTHEREAPPPPPPAAEIQGRRVVRQESLGTAASAQASGVASVLLPRAAATPADTHDGLDEPAAPLLDDTHTRLVALEQRAARAEARIAEQDQLIHRLQQTLSRIGYALLDPTGSSRV